MSHEEIKEYIEIEKSLQSQPKCHRLYGERFFCNFKIKPLLISAGNLLKSKQEELRFICSQINHIECKIKLVIEKKTKCTCCMQHCII